MQFSKTFLPLILCNLLLAACAGALPPQTTATPEPAASPSVISPAPATLFPSPAPSLTSTASPSPAVSPTLAAPPPATSTAPPQPTAEASPRTLYVLDAVLDYVAHSLVVKQEITYFNTTPETLTMLPLVIEARNYPGAFHLSGVFASDGQRITSYQLRDAQLNLVFPQPLAPGASLQFSLAYELQLPASSRLPTIRPHPFGYTEVQTNLGDWYPFVPPYQPGKGWLVHPARLYGEYLAEDIADYEVTVQVTGAAPVIAASAPARFDGQRYHYQLQSARSFAWSASPYYQVITQTVVLSQPVTVASYYFAFYEKPGARVVETAAQSLALYSRLFEAPYTRPMLSIVQADFIDGMEYDGLYFLGEDFYEWYNNSSESFLVSLAAHETAHQWWYGLVGNDPALEPWLDEALCTYSERLYYENVFPESLRWWWAYRVDYYEPTGHIDLSIYDVPDVYGQYRTYRDAVYLNGAKFVEDLRMLVGDEAFFAILRSYVQQHALGLGSARSFFALVRQHSAADLGPLMEKYFAKPIP